MGDRSREREQFLADVLQSAINHAGYGFSGARMSHFSEESPADSYAEITDRHLEPGDEGYGEYQRVDIEVIARGLRVIREAQRGADGELYVGEGQRLYYDGDNRDDLMLADRTNGADGDVDVIAAMAALECGMFGQVVYA